MDVILLAAGNSVRFGANKLLYCLDGKKMYRHILELLYRMKCEENFENIVVVSQYEEIFEDIREAFPGIETVCNPEPEKGVSGSIRLGLKKLSEISPDSGSCLFTVADQPYLTAESLEKLKKTWEDNTEGIVAASHGEWIGNPVVFHARYYEELKRLTGDVGGKRVLRMHEEDVRLCEIPERELRDMDTPEMSRMRVLIKGAGDLATGIACRLYVCGFQIIMTEISVPLTVRRTVAFSRAVYEEMAVVEGVTGRLAHTPDEIEQILEGNEIAVIVDPNVRYMDVYHPDVVVDAILAKKNLGTTMADADLVIGVGPGFTAGKDCHLVVETKRGHYLGRVIYEGSAIPNTGIPGEIDGYSIERLIKATGDGEFIPAVSIGDFVEKGQIVGYNGEKPVYALMSGVVRGMLQSGVQVTEGLKCGDIDARGVVNHCYTVSDKARAIGGGVLEAILSHCHHVSHEVDKGKDII